MPEQTPSPLETASWSTQELRVAVHIVGLLVALRTPEGESPALTPEQKEQYEQVINPDLPEDQLHQGLGETPKTTQEQLTSLLEDLSKAAGLPEKQALREKELASIRILADIAINVSPDGMHPTEGLIKTLAGAIPALNRTRPLIDELLRAVKPPVGRRVAAMLEERGITQAAAHRILSADGGPSESSIARFLSGRTHGTSTTVLKPLLTDVLKLPPGEVKVILADYKAERDPIIRDPKRERPRRAKKT